MLKIRLNIQKFGGGNGWTAGISGDGIRGAYQRFSTEIDETISTIENHAAVDSALREGWSGSDCETFIERFDTHARNLSARIETYRTNVANEVEKVLIQWDDFQQGLIS